MTTQMKLIDLLALKWRGIVDLCKTSDGHYLGMPEGDIGFNDFIGQPQAPHPGPGLNRMLSIWKGFTNAERQQVNDLASEKGIDLEAEFGVPTSEILTA